MVDRRAAHLTCSDGASALKKGGSLSPPAALPCGATMLRARRRQAMPALHGALPHRIRAIRANLRPMRIPEHNLDHTGEGSAL